MGETIPKNSPPFRSEKPGVFIGKGGHEGGITGPRIEAQHVALP